MKIDKQVNVLDLIKFIALALGGIITFLLIEYVSTKNDTLRTQKMFLDELPGLYPNLNMKYTNQFNKSGDTLQVRVFLESLCRYPVVIENPPLIFLYDSTGKNNGDYFIYNLDEFSGTVSPKSKFQITYHIQANPEKHSEVSVSYQAKIDDRIKNVYSDIFDQNIDGIDAEAIDYITVKTFGYKEEIYGYKKNDIWSDFFINPR